MAFAIEAGLEAFLRALPKTETHLHIEGALRWELYRQVCPEAEPPASWSNAFKYRDFAHFEDELLAMATHWYTSPERYGQAARAQFEHLLAQNVRYVECSFASGVVEFLNLDACAIAEAIAAAAPDGMEVRVFMGIHHNGCGPRMRGVIEEALQCAAVAGLDLHGPEDVPLEPWTAELWQQARAAGKYTKAHAGEFCGADFVERILDEVRPHRIQHGTRAAQSKQLVERLRKEGVALDMCPISNAKLMPGVSLENHPFGELMEQGVVVTVSTDDPLCFGNTLLEEYAVLHRYQGFGDEQLRQVARNGWQVALVADEERESFIRTIDAVEADVGFTF